MNPEIEQLKQQLAELTERFNALTSTATIPYDIEQALKHRLSQALFAESTKGVDSEDVTVVNSVNFGAQSVGTTVVLDDPDAFIQVVVNGTIYHLPAWTS